MSICLSITPPSSLICLYDHNWWSWHDISEEVCISISSDATICIHWKVRWSPMWKICLANLLQNVQNFGKQGFRQNFRVLAQASIQFIIIRFCPGNVWKYGINEGGAGGCQNWMLSQNQFPGDRLFISFSCHFVGIFRLVSSTPASGHSWAQVVINWDG